MRGETLRAIREAIGWSPSQLARVLGSDLDVIGRMERGAEPVDGRTELAIQNLCTLSYEELDSLLVTPPLPGSEMTALVGLH